MATAAQMGWTLLTLDIEKAFLQGITYEELAQETGSALVSGVAVYYEDKVGSCMMCIE